MNIVFLNAEFAPYELKESSLQEVVTRLKDVEQQIFIQWHCFTVKVASSTVAVWNPVSLWIFCPLGVGKIPQ